MQAQRILDQAEIAEIIAAVFSYNGMTASDIAFDISDGLRAIVTTDDTPLKVCDTPEPENPESYDAMSTAMLQRMRTRQGA